MNKPNSYESTQKSGAFTRLPAGNYLLKVMGVEETKSKTGKPMIVVSYDIAEGDYKDYFTKSYKADTREDKKWGGRHWIMTEDANGNCSRNFKTFVSCIEDSNPGYTAQWGENFCKSLKGKQIACQMRDEEYLTSRGERRMTAKIGYFNTVDEYKKGMPLLDPKFPPADEGNVIDQIDNAFSSVADADELPFA